MGRYLKARAGVLQKGPGFAGALFSGLCPRKGRPRVRLVQSNQLAAAYAANAF